MPTTTLRITTDGDGYFHKTERLNPPGRLNMTVDLKAKLVRPESTQVSATIDIDAADGSPANQEKRFVLTTGQSVSLGSWKLDGDDNIVVISGRTAPVRSNAELVFEITATL
jgi:hypothetical protein